MADLHWVQAADLANQMAGERLGDTPVTEEDWSNLKTIGDKVFSNKEAIEQGHNALMLQIGKTIFSNQKPFEMDAPKSIIVDNREFATVTRKIKLQYEDAVINSARELEDGVSYDPNVYHALKVSEHFYKSKATFAIEEPSIKTYQFKESFNGPDAFGTFIDAQWDLVLRQQSFAMQNLIKGLLADRIAHNIVSAGNSPMVINVREMYNQETGNNVEKDKWRTNQDAMRYAFMIMKRTAAMMKDRKKIYNVDREDRFTPSDYLRFVLLADVVSAADFYLYNGLNQVLTDKLTVPEFETISSWQGGGQNDSFFECSKISRKIMKADGTTAGVEQDGIIGLMFDREALMITPYDFRGTSHYNPKGEFINPFYKAELGYINQLDENAVVFTIT